MDFFIYGASTWASDCWSQAEQLCSTSSTATSHKVNSVRWIWDTGCQWLCYTTVLLQKIQRRRIMASKHEKPQNHSQKSSNHPQETEFTLSQSALLLTGCSGNTNSKHSIHICQHILSSVFCGYFFRYRNVSGPHPFVLWIQKLEDVLL